MAEFTQQRPLLENWVLILFAASWQNAPSDVSILEGLVFA